MNRLNKTLFATVIVLGSLLVYQENKHPVIVCATSSKQCEPEPTPTKKYTPTPTPTDVITPTPTFTPTPTQSPTPTPTQEITPTPTITPTVTVTPTPTITTQTEEAKEAGPSGEYVCAAPTPKETAGIVVETGTPNDGCLDVKWWPMDNASKVRIDYGPYGANLPYVAVFNHDDGKQEICGLTNGVGYEACVTGINVCGQEGVRSTCPDPLP